METSGLRAVFFLIKFELERSLEYAFGLPQSNIMLNFEGFFCCENQCLQIMRYVKTAILLILLNAAQVCLFAQDRGDSSGPGNKVQLFGNLYHQHHNFFKKAFSYQGLEGGIVVQKSLYLGIYGVFFASDLKAEINNTAQQVWIGQGGINAAYIFHQKSRIHPGCQMNIGLFSMRYDKDSFGLFETGKAASKLNGLVLSPQVFGELNLADWFKIRTGLSYNFYWYKNHSEIQTSDLDHLSFTFGLVFTGRSVN